MRTGLVLALAAVVTFTAAPAFAQLMLVERSTESFGVDPLVPITTVEWDSSFADLNYAVGNPINLTVTWDVQPGGTATFDSFVLRGKKYTPIAKNNPRTIGDRATDGTDPLGAVTALDSSVTTTFQFNKLHSTGEGVGKGNVHLTLLLNVDSTGDGVVDTPARFGVNVHVEDPA